MADGFSFDFSDLTKLAAQFQNVDDELPKGTSRAVTASAYQVAKLWRASLQGSDVPAAASTVQYRVQAGRTEVNAEIASDRGTARLIGYAHAREYGSLTVAPFGDARKALQGTLDDFERGLRIAGERAIERALNT
jgi:hypothetical protein